MFYLTVKLLLKLLTQSKSPPPSWYGSVISDSYHHSWPQLRISKLDTWSCGYVMVISVQMKWPKRKVTLLVWNQLVAQLSILPTEPLRNGPKICIVKVGRVTLGKSLTNSLSEAQIVTNLLVKSWVEAIWSKLWWYSLDVATSGKTY